MFAVTNVTIHQPDHTIPNGTIWVDKGKIIRIEHNTVEDAIDGGGFNLVPGFIDSHIHGAMGADVMDDIEALKTMAASLPVEGTTAFLPTTITSPETDIASALERIRDFKLEKAPHAEVIGAHVEGPFIAKSKAGAQPVECIRRPELALVKEWHKKGVLRVITMAPELEGAAEVMEWLSEKGTVISAGHTEAVYEDIVSAQEKGLQHLTHLCNAMTGVHHRNVGAVGAAMLAKELYSEIIPDRIHISDEMLRILYSMIGPERLILITDAMRAKGLGDGAYTLGGQEVNVKGTRATLADGTLAGSVLMMDQGVRNMIEVCGADWYAIMKMASENPARRYGIWDRKGSIEVGKDADFLLVDDHFHIHSTFCRGEEVKK
ncbi:N-acetylglucosamine-6-phosphate deacetylase [Thalassobacillus hwangdonensis]|uniref:N-acetylglucosamine-6-phosphate deacetylase n=1 Tax=Thalassobacillus hwangdonensis TaxID=546108 RepID=A0ABW3L227_9BACI